MGKPPEKKPTFQQKLEAMIQGLKKKPKAAPLLSPAEEQIAADLMAKTKAFFQGQPIVTAHDPIVYGIDMVKSPLSEADWSAITKATISKDGKVFIIDSFSEAFHEGAAKLTGVPLTGTSISEERAFKTEILGTWGPPTLTKLGDYGDYSALEKKVLANLPPKEKEALLSNIFPSLKEELAAKQYAGEFKTVLPIDPTEKVEIVPVKLPSMTEEEAKKVKADWLAKHQEEQLAQQVEKMNAQEAQYKAFVSKEIGLDWSTVSGSMHFSGTNLQKVPKPEIKMGGGFPIGKLTSLSMSSKVSDLQALKAQLQNIQKQIADCEKMFVDQAWIDALWKEQVRLENEITKLEATAQQPPGGFTTIPKAPILDEAQLAKIVEEMSEQLVKAMGIPKEFLDPATVNPKQMPPSFDFAKMKQPSPHNQKKLEEIKQKLAQKTHLPDVSAKVKQVEKVEAAKAALLGAMGKDISEKLSMFYSTAHPWAAEEPTFLKQLCEAMEEKWGVKTDIKVKTVPDKTPLATCEAWLNGQVHCIPVKIIVTDPATSDGSALLFEQTNNEPLVEDDELAEGEEVVELTLHGLTREEAEAVLKHIGKNKKGVYVEKAVRKDVGSGSKAICGWPFESATRQVNNEPIMYIAQLNEDGSTSCNCPGWTMGSAKSAGGRFCKHTKEIQAEASAVYKKWEKGEKFGEDFQEVSAETVKAKPKEASIKIKEAKKQITHAPGEATTFIAKRVIEL